MRTFESELRFPLRGPTSAIIVPLRVTAPRQATSRGALVVMATYPEQNPFCGARELGEMGWRILTGCS